MTPSQKLEWLFVLYTASSWFFPIGALVLRRRLSDADGGIRVFKYLLYALAFASLPFAIYFAGVLVVFVAIDTLDSLYRILAGIH